MIPQIFPVNSYSYVAMAPWQSMHPGQHKGSVTGILVWVNLFQGAKFSLKIIFWYLKQIYWKFVPLLNKINNMQSYMEHICIKFLNLQTSYIRLIQFYVLLNMASEKIIHVRPLVRHSLFLQYMITTQITLRIKLMSSFQISLKLLIKCPANACLLHRLNYYVIHDSYLEWIEHFLTAW